MTKLLIMNSGKKNPLVL